MSYSAGAGALTSGAFTLASPTPSLAFDQFEMRIFGYALFGARKISLKPSYHSGG
jgi:hypothetical protein